MRPMRWPGALASVVLLLAGCTAAPATASPPDDGEAPPTETAAAMATETADDGGGEDEQVTVTIAGFSFGDDITVPPGTTVTFVNEDSAPHTVTHGSDGVAMDGAEFDEPVAAGESVEITFDEAGSFPITCTIHPSMNMTVTVEG